MVDNKAAAQSSSYRARQSVLADLTIWEKLDIIPAQIFTLANIIGALFTGVLRSKEKKPASFSRYVALTAIRTLTSRTSARQQHYIAPATDDAYATACKKFGITANSEVLEDGTRAHWIGDSKAEKIIINFHGGGFVFPPAPEFFKFLSQIVQVLEKQGKSVAVLFLSYDLAPGAVYPRQLQQAASLLHHVLTKLSINPQNIVLTGDSAGGNLALGLLSHISHPHPSGTIQAIDLGGKKIAGTVLISPWVNFNTDFPSFAANKYKDCIDPFAIHQWSSAFLGEGYPHPTKPDYYNEASKAPESWWNGLAVENVLIVAGEEEVLVDGIVAWEKEFRRGFGEDRVETLVAKGEYHDQPNLDVQLGVKESDESEQAKLIKRWIGSKL